MSNRIAERHTLLSERAAANQERRYLRALVSSAHDALKTARKSEALPHQRDTAIDMAERAIRDVFNRLTDKIVEHEVEADR